MSKQKKADKKALVLGTGKKKGPLALIVLVSVAFLIVAGGLVFMSLKDRQPAAVAASGGTYNPAAQTISYPADLFSDGSARHFTYQAENDLNVRYFILKSSDGIIRAAFDACDVCWPAGKGYYQEGDDMVCRNCGRRFASVLVNEVKGGCNPAPLQRQVVDGQLVLKVSDIVQGGRQYFDFSRRG